MEAIGGRKLNAANFKFSFLTDHIKLDDESPQARAKRAEFVRGVLQPAAHLSSELKKETQDLQDNIKTEVAICIEGMRRFVKRKLAEGEQKLRKVQLRLERQDKEFRKDEEVSIILTEIQHLYDRAQKTVEQMQELQTQLEQYQCQAATVSETCNSRGQELAELSKVNAALQRTVQQWKQHESHTAATNILRLFDVVPFEAFQERSEKAIGQLTLAQISRCREFSREIRSIQEEIAAFREANSHLRTQKLKRRVSTLEAQFRLCVESVSPPSPRAFSSTRELRFKGFPISTGFDTVLSARLHEIHSARESLVKERKRKKAVTKADLRSMSVEEVLRLVQQDPSCMRCLLHFLRHPNSLKASDSAALDSVSSKRYGAFTAR